MLLLGLLSASSFQSAHPAPVSVRAHESWRHANPAATAISLLDNNLGQVVTLLHTSTGSVVSIISAEGDLLRTATNPEAYATTLAVNALGEVAFSTYYGSYGFAVRTTVLSPDLSVTNWSLQTSPAAAYSQYVVASVLDTNGHAFYGGLFRPHHTGGDVYYVLGHGKTDPAWFVRGPDAWSYDNERVNAITLTSAGNVVLCENYFFGWGRSDCYLGCFSPDGTIKWFNHAANFPAVASAADRDGNMIVVGRTGESTGMCSTIKVSSEGLTLWDRRRSTVGASALAVSSDNAIYVATAADLTKYAPDGRELWTLQAGGAALACDSSGHVYMAASDESRPGERDILLTKLSSDGHLLWRARFERQGNGDDILVRLLARDDGAYLLVNSAANGVTTAIVTKYVDVAEVSRQEFVDEATAIAAPVEFESMSNTEPFGQEFVPDLPAIDFIELTVANGSPARLQVRLHSESISGPLLAESGIVVHASNVTERLRFVFPSTVPVVPGAKIVFELIQVDAADAQDPPSIAITSGEAYTRGDFIRRGSPEQQRDLAFSAGAFVPEILTEGSAVRLPENTAVLIAPVATFTNQFFTDASGIFLVVSVSGATTDDFFSIAGADDGHWIAVNGREVAYAEQGEAGAALQVRFFEGATLYDVEQVLRRLTYGNSAEDPATAARTISIAVNHPLAGSITVPISLSILPTNDPPVPVLKVVNQTQWGVILVRGRTAPVVLDASESTDVDSTNFLFNWWILSATVTNSAAARVTNYFKAGTHNVSCDVGDGIGYSTGTISFQVTRAAIAIKDIEHRVRDSRFPSSVRQFLMRPMQRSLSALRRQDYRTAKAELQRVNDRIAFLSEDPDILIFFGPAVDDIRSAVTELLGAAGWP